MNDVQQLCDQLDRLHTGLPDRPDVSAVVAAGRRRRRHRRLAVTAGLGVAAVALATPFAVAGLRTTAQPEGGVASEAPSAYVARTSPPRGPAGPEFGEGVRAAVSHSVPEATFHDETLADGFAQASVDGNTVYEWSVHTPPTWSSLFAWQQDYTLDSGATLEVTSSRTTPTVTEVSPDFARCDAAATERSCEASDVPGGRLRVEDGLQLDAPDVWYREVSLVDTSATRGMMAEIQVSASVQASTWEEAQTLLPAVPALTELAQDPALVLPAPAAYPPFPQG
jgi:hypothetical protein